GVRELLGPRVGKAGGWISRRISFALERRSSAREGRERTCVLSPPRNWGGQLSAVAAATVFQVSRATETLRPPPPEAVTAVRGRHRLHQLASQPPEGKGKVRHSSGSSWHAGHRCAQQEIDEDRIPNPLLKSTLSMSPRQRKKVTRTTPTMKELQMMVEHHLGQQQQGEEPEGAAESTGTQESCPPGITDTEAELRLGPSGKAQKPAESIPKTQERGSEKPSTGEPTTHIPPLDSQGANSV
uniref:Protein phosphatase 1 regulatory subunit 1A n=1 Tax=Felis catus TaxID=9685 RepID=A0ABI8A379_FELCA